MKKKHTVIKKSSVLFVHGNVFNHYFVSVLLAACDVAEISQRYCVHVIAARFVKS